MFESRHVRQRTNRRIFMGLFDKVMSGVSAVTAAATGLSMDYAKDRTIELKGMPENLDELKSMVDVSDPGSVAAYWLYGVMALTADYDIGMSMLKYLFADLEPFGRGFTEGGNVGKAGFDPFFNDRLKSDDYRWLPRAYFKGAVASNGFKPAEPLAVELHYNAPNTQATNDQSLSQDIWRQGVKIVNAYKTDERLQWSKLKEALATGNLLIKEKDIIDDECSKTVWKYDEENKKVIYEIDDDIFHPDALDALRYANYYLSTKKCGDKFATIK